MSDIDMSGLEQAKHELDAHNFEIENHKLKKEIKYIKNVLAVLSEKIADSDPVISKAVSSYLKERRIDFIGYTVKEMAHVKETIGMPPMQQDRWLDYILKINDWQKCELFGHPVQWDYIFTGEYICDYTDHERKPHAHILCTECNKNWVTYEGTGPVYYRSVGLGEELEASPEFKTCPDDASDTAACLYSALGAHQHTYGDVVYNYHPVHDEARAKWERRRIDPEIKPLFRRASNP